MMFDVVFGNVMWCGIPALDSTVEGAFFKFAGSVCWYFHFLLFGCSGVCLHEIFLVLRV